MFPVRFLKDAYAGNVVVFVVLVIRTHGPRIMVFHIDTEHSEFSPAAEKTSDAFCAEWGVKLIALIPLPGEKHCWLIAPVVCTTCVLTLD